MHKVYRAQQTVFTCMLRIHKPYTLRVVCNLTIVHQIKINIMKKLLLLFLSVSLLSCSSSDDESKKELPEKFDITIEIKGKYSIPRVNISVNSIVVKDWNNIDLPVTSEYTYYTSGDEITNVETACDCTTISVWAYISSINEMEVFNLYIDGELVDSTTITRNSVNGIITPTILEFVY